MHNLLISIQMYRLNNSIRLPSQTYLPWGSHHHLDQMWNWKDSRIEVKFKLEKVTIIKEYVKF